MYEEFIKQKSVELHKESIDRPGRPCYNGEQKGGGSMEIRPVLENKRQYMDLLFLADEQVEMIERYLNAGVARVILGTKAVTDEDFLRDAVGRWGERIAVGVDAKDGRVAVKGWVEVLDVDMFDFLWKLRSLGVKTAIVTDISKDGAMKGTNLPLYERLSRLDGIDITASGGVSTLEDIRALRDMGLYGAILGKAMYNGAIKLKDALDVARG